MGKADAESADNVGVTFRDGGVFFFFCKEAASRRCEGFEGGGPKYSPHVMWCDVSGGERRTRPLRLQKPLPLTVCPSTSSPLFSSALSSQLDQIRLLRWLASRQKPSLFVLNQRRGGGGGDETCVRNATRERAPGKACALYSKGPVMEPSVFRQDGNRSQVPKEPRLISWHRILMWHLSGREMSTELLWEKKKGGFTPSWISSVFTVFISLHFSGLQINFNDRGKGHVSHREMHF